MPPTILDCRGMPCPQPVLRTKESLEQGTESIEVLVDNEASCSNVSRFAGSQGHVVETSARPDGAYVIRITASLKGQAQPFDPADYPCPLPARTRLLYVISADSMGRGSEELGWALMQTYIQTIKDVSPLPEKVLLYNSGVKLVATPSGALEALRDLQARGVEILACGTCLDFFQLKSAIQVGRISNMYDIMQAMSDADKIVSPY